MGTYPKRSLSLPESLDCLKFLKHPLKSQKSLKILTTSFSEVLGASSNKFSLVSSSLHRTYLKFSDFVWCLDNFPEVCRLLWGSDKGLEVCRIYWVSWSSQSFREFSIAKFSWSLPSFPDVHKIYLNFLELSMNMSIAKINVNPFYGTLISGTVKSKMFGISIGCAWNHVGERLELRYKRLGTFGITLGIIWNLCLGCLDSKLHTPVIQIRKASDRHLEHLEFQ